MQSPSAPAYAPGQRDTRPWGEWLVIDAGPGYVVKRITVRPGQRLSLQRHRHRAE
ncbi:MAG TPA: mannose-1-phosphate guanylyltransferase/mannose-6-phosphate isomerase, partial [Acetobacteraceae bacterium]|nr:mannose-1-phosphate guanylyltransferase/mannose-6-phosphate isomerase [Acetobacteraceae bacterium]